MNRCLCVITLCVIGGLAGCANDEVENTSEAISRVHGIRRSIVGCNDGVFAQSRLCAQLEMDDGLVIAFSDFGYHSLGPSASVVNLTSIGDIRPVVSQCAASGAGPGVETIATKAEIHRSGMFGALLSPPISDAAEAVERRREVHTALAAWPACPEFWSFETSANTRVRYCATSPDAQDSGPSPDPLCAP